MQKEIKDKAYDLVKEQRNKEKNNTNHKTKDEEFIQFSKVKLTK